jgi:hypothetical protein
MLSQGNRRSIVSTTTLAAQDCVRGTLAGIVRADQWLTPQPFVLSKDETVLIPRFSLPFKVVGTREDFGNKPPVVSEDKVVYPELAILNLLLRNDFEDGVWVDTYRHKFWKCMPVDCDLPARARPIYDRIVRANSNRLGGCWDVIAWKHDKFVFIESKGPGDKIRRNQVLWLAAAKRAGIDLGCFAVCEWTAE